MKNILLFVFAFIATNHVVGQLISEDFESYSDSSFVFQDDSNDIWSTWSGTITADALIIDTSIARSGSHVVFIDEGNDIVMDFGDRTTGRYEVLFHMWIVESKAAYFNLLQNFDGGDSDWGMQINFQPHGIAILDAGYNDIDTFNFNNDVWIPVKLIIDIDDDFATVYFDGVELRSWKWSLGAQGNNNVNKLDALNFYGLSGNDGSSGFYVDDITFTEVESFDAPTDLTVVVNDGDAALSWTAPGAYTPVSYSLMKNSQELSHSISEASYNDLNLYPSTYEYAVRAAKADLGYSSASNTASVTLDGGIARDVVLYEVVTGTWCPNCPAASRGVEEMADSNYDVAVIEYHGGDAYENEAASDRINFYGTTGYPTTYIDGNSIIGGGGYTGTNFDSYLNTYKVRDSVSAVYDINFTGKRSGDSSFVFDISIEALSSYFEGRSLRVYVALTESHIEERWQGMQYLDFVLQRMYPSGLGQALTVDPSSNFQYSFEESIDTNKMRLENCEFVVFIQDVGSNEVLQASRIAVKEMYGVGIKELSSAMMVYPNPSNQFLNIESSQIDAIQLFNINGQMVYSKVAQMSNYERIEVDELQQGIYLLRVIEGDNIYTTRVSIR
jgi:hypothetical protein